MSQTATEAAAYVATYQQTTQRLRDQLVAFITALWRSLGAYRNDQMAQFIAQVVPVVAGAEQQMVSLTSAYLAAQKSAVLGTPFTPVAVDPGASTGAALRNGTDPETVYGRPFHLVWRELGQGVDPQTAVKSGLDRAVQSGLTDLQLAKTHASQQVMDADGHAVGYRRVLEGAHSCGLCVVASTQRYHKADLLPIHPACDCAVEPLYSDTGQVSDPQLLEAAHAAVKATFGVSDAGARSPDYRKLLITHHHGELGPVLGVRGRPFVGPSQIT